MSSIDERWPEANNANPDNLAGIAGLAGGAVGAGGMALASSKLLGNLNFVNYSEKDGKRMAGKLYKEILGKSSKKHRYPQLHTISDAKRSWTLPTSLSSILRRSAVKGMMDKGKLRVSDSVAQKIIEKGGIVSNVRAPSILAHELGHNAAHRRYGSLLSNLMSMGSKPAAVGGALLGAGLAFDSKEGDWKGKAAIPVALAGSIPVLTDEFLASKHAVKALRKLDPANVKTMTKNLQRAWGTYGAAAAALAVPTAAILAAKAVDRTIKKQKKKRLDRVSEEAFQDELRQIRR